MREAATTFRIPPPAAVSLRPRLPNQLTDAILTTGLDGIINSCNLGLSRFGLEPEDVVGTNLAYLFSAEDQSVLTQLVIPAVREKGRCEATLHGRTRRGEEYTVRICLSLLRDGTSNPIGMVAVVSEAAEKPRMQGRSEAGSGTSPERNGAARHRGNGVPDRQPRHAQIHGPRGPRRRTHRNGAGGRRDGNRQGTGRTHHPRIVVPAQESACRYQLRRPTRTSGRERIVRLRERRVQRRGLVQARTVRARRPEHDLPRRNRRTPAPDSGEAAARAGRRAVLPAWWPSQNHRRCARSGGHQPGSR